MPIQPSVNLPVCSVEDPGARLDELFAQVASGHHQLLVGDNGQEAVMISAPAFLRLVKSSSNTTMLEMFSATRPVDLGDFEEEFDQILEDIRHPGANASRTLEGD